MDSIVLVSLVLALLVGATIAGQLLRRRESPELDRQVIETFNGRIQSWWFFTIVIVFAFVWPALTVILFALISFLALREFVTLTPTRIGDHRALFWVFFFFTPMQFFLVYMDYYHVYSVMIPVGAFLFIATRSAIYGDYDRFFERIAKVQCALMICVYCLSFAPALLYLQCKGEGEAQDPARLLFFFITIVLAADLMEWAWSRIFSRHIIAEKIDPTTSWEGVLAGSASTAILGGLLYWATPFGAWWQAVAISFVVAALSAAGSLTVAAIKRDRGEADAGTVIEGQGGVLSRIDSICFAAPVFYHLTRYFFT